jgi:hypothetical protein
MANEMSSKRHTVKKGSNICTSYELVTSVKLSMSKLTRIVGSLQGCSRVVIFVLERSFGKEPLYSLLCRRPQSLCEQCGELTSGTQTCKCSGMHDAVLTESVVPPKPNGLPSSLSCLHVHVS